MDRKAKSDANGNSDSFRIWHAPGSPEDGGEGPSTPDAEEHKSQVPAHITGALCGFRDALGLAMQLADEYAFISAGVMLDGTGHVIDVVSTQGIGRPVGPLVGRVCTALGGPKQPPDVGAGQRPGATTAVVLLTVRPFDADVIREADLNLFRQARWAIEVAGVELLDWIETDGDLFRSYAYVTCPALAWPDDPPGERLDRAWSV